VKRGVWRGHRRRYDAADHGGSLLVSGRYHQGQDLFPPEETWPALYLGMDLHVALGEIQRVKSDRRIVDYRFTELWVEIEAVLDCRDTALLGLDVNEMIGDYSYDITRRIAAAAMSLGVEGILVPSATLLGDNLILFPDRIRTGSVIVEVRSIDPRLVKEG
jgi:hypothetical protein